jgi:hypothetical protein
MHVETKSEDPGLPQIALEQQQLALAPPEGQYAVT